MFSAVDETSPQTMTIASGASRAAAARRLIIARTSRRSSARPVSRLPAGSMVWKSAAFGSSSSRPAST